MADEVSITRVIESSRYKKNIKKLSKKYRLIREDVRPLIEQLEKGETPGDRLTGNDYAVYKVRVKNSDNNKG